MRFKNFRIITKTTSIICVVVAALIVTLIISSYELVTGRFKELEKKDTGILVHQALNRLKNTLEKVESSTRDYAPWDDTYKFVRDGNRAFVEKNMPNDTFINLNLNFMLFYNENGKLERQKFFDLNETKEVGQDAEVTRALSATPQVMLHGNKDVHGHLAGIFITPSGTPLLIAAAPIVTSKFEGPIRGTLIMGRFLDDAEVKKMCADTELSIRIYPYQNTKISLPASVLLGDDLLSRHVHVQEASPRTVTGYAVLPDVTGKPALTVEVMHDREIFQQGLAMWKQHAVSMAFLGCVFIVTLLGLLNRLVLQKLTKMTNEVGIISAKGSHGLRLAVQSSDEIGYLAGQINAMLDSLERYQALQAENEHYLKELLESINCGVLVIDIDNRLIVDINKAGAALLQRQAEDLIGKSCHQFVCSGETNHCPVLDFGESIDLGEGVVLRADGSELPVLKSASTVERGGQRYVIESFIDISRLKEAQKELKEGEAKYRQFFEEDLTSNFICAPNGRILDCNPSFAQMLGYRTVAEAKQATITSHYFTPTDRESNIKKISLEKQLERHEWKLRHLNGDPIYCIGNAIAVFNERGEPTQYRCYFFDDTRRVLLEKDMRQSQKLEAIGTMAGGIAHDFNNILAGIMGFTEIIMRDLGNTVPLRVNQYLRNILSAGERASDLIRQILAFSRGSEMELRPVLLRQAVEDVLQLIRASLPATIVIEQRFDSQAAVMADQAQLHQIIMNLCTNAGYAMKNGGGILTLSLEDVTLDHTFTDRYQHLEPGNYVRLRVSDTGEGIPEHLQDRIFDPFFTTKNKGEGTGLGLSMVHGIVSSMKGLITVDSTTGQETRFDIYLPVIADTTECPRTEKETLPIGSEHIVYVDDDPFLVEIGKEMLHCQGYRVTAFTQSLEALKYLSEHQAEVDLLVTDMTMPTVTGLDLARSLLQQRPRVPVILCTGNSEGLSTARARELGISDFLLKPITVSGLTGKVRTVLDKTRGEQQAV